MKQILIKQNSYFTEDKTFITFPLKTDQQLNLKPGVNHVVLSWPIELITAETLSFFVTLPAKIAGLGVLLSSYHVSSNQILLFLININDTVVYIDLDTEIALCHAYEPVQIRAIKAEKSENGVLIMDKPKPKKRLKKESK